VLARVLHLTELVADHQLLDRRERDAVDDRLDVVAVAALGGDPPGRRVRVRQEAGALELREHGAHGRAGHAEAIALDERLAADRCGGGDVFLDDGPKDRLGAKVQEAAQLTRSSRHGASPERELAL
jgi:hypothetical protein